MPGHMKLFSAFCAVLLISSNAACSKLPGSKSSEGIDETTLASLIALAGAGGGDNGSTALTISGTLTGTLGGGSVDLRLTTTGQTNLNVAAAGSFAFATTVTAGTAYSIKLTSQPNYTFGTCSAANTRRCTLANSSGTVGTNSVTNVGVSCVSILAANCNAVKDGTESDTDCGGTTAALCPSNRTCGANSDCQSGVCNLSSNPATCQ